MRRFCDKRALVPSVLLAFLLLAAQFAGLAHAYEHDASAPQNQTCTSCIAASQLASACVDIPATTDAEAPGLSRYTLQEIEFESPHVIVVRQRGPPASL